MKRIIAFSLIILAFALTSSAQYFGLQAGGLLSNVNWKNKNVTANTKIKPGFLAGISLEIPVHKSMAINTALNYKVMGASMWDTASFAALRLHYINFDVTFNYIFKLGSVEPYIEAGPYLAFAVKAQEVYQPDSVDTFKEDLKIGTSKDDDIRPLDAGFTIGVGLYVSNFKFGLGYSHGFVNISPGDDYSIRNRNGYLRVTYFINRKKKEKSIQ